MARNPMTLLQSRACRRARRGATTLLLALAALACRRTESVAPGAGSRPAAAPAAASTTLVVATNGELGGVNELAVTTTRRFDQDVQGALFLHLLRERPDYQQHPPTFEPQLARSWELSPDGRLLTFHLRDDVQWSDGRPVTADDVRFTWQAQTSKEVGWASAYLKESITDVEVVDPRTVRFHFSRVYPTQLLDANEGLILPAHAWRQLPFAKWPQGGDWFRDHLVVDGPFTIEAWKPQEELVLRRNARYFEPGKPHLERIVFRVVPDEAARMQELLAGEAQVMEAVPPDRAEEVTRTPGRTIVPVWTRQYTAIVWNTQRPPLEQREVRRALTLAIDRAGLVEALWRGHARVADSPILSTVWAHPADLDALPYDPAEARRLLAAHGFADADGDGILELRGKPFRLEISTTSGNQVRHDALVLIQEQLARAGIAVDPVFREPGAEMAKRQGHDFTGALTAWGIPTDLDLRYAFDGRDPDGTNWGSYRNPEVDRLLDTIERQRDWNDVLPLLAHAQQLIAEDQPFTFLWEPQSLIGMDARITGARPNALSTFWGLEDWQLESRGSHAR
jgi:peptide/nickel transport system substrate-binding protein